MRGDFVIAATQGTFGKPRPPISYFRQTCSGEHVTVTVLPAANTMVDVPLLRINVEPSASNGFKKTIADYGRKGNAH